MSTLNTYNLKSPDSANTNLALDASGNVAIQAGSASTPSVYVTGDANTGLYSPGADQVALTTGGTARLYIDSSGRVGIGTSTPARQLDLYDATAPTFALHNASSGTGNSDGFLLFTLGSDTSLFNYENGYMAFGTNGTERFRCDASGRLLVGTSSTPQDFRLVVQGNPANSEGRVAIQTGTTNPSSGTAIGRIFFSDGNGNVCSNIACESDGTWGTNDYPGRLVFSTTADGASSPTQRLVIQSDGVLFLYNTGALAPNVDNTATCGGNGFRWSQIWAANGTIQTSDQRAKTDISSSTLGADFIKALRPVSYKWIEGGKRDTGERDSDGNYIYESVPGERTHWGFIAQEVKQAVDAAGVDFGGWVLTDKDDPDSQQALRYDQFIAPLTKALQEALAEIDVLKAKVAALESA